MTLTMSPTVPGPLLLRRARATVPVTIYGSRSSVRSSAVRLYLTRVGVIHDFVDVGRGTPARRSASLPVSPPVSPPLPTPRSTPLPSVLLDGEWLHAPCIEELERALERHGLIESGAGMTH